MSYPPSMGHVMFTQRIGRHWVVRCSCQTVGAGGGGVAARLSHAIEFVEHSQKLIPGYRTR